MQTVKRRCAQTAHISLQISCFQRAIFGQKFQRALVLSASSKALSSDFPNSCYYLRRRIHPSPSLCRFGEAVFTVGRRKPQGQKTQTVTFFSCLSNSLRNLGVDENFGTSEMLFAQHCCERLGRCGQIDADLTLRSTARQGRAVGHLGKWRRFPPLFACGPLESSLCSSNRTGASRCARTESVPINPRCRARSWSLTSPVFRLTC